jgi:hypothetical protein
MTTEKCLASAAAQRLKARLQGDSFGTPERRALIRPLRQLIISVLQEFSEIHQHRRFA